MCQVALPVLVFAGCFSSPARGPTEKDSAGPSPDQVVLHGVRLQRFEADRLRQEATAERAVMDRRTGQVEGFRIRGDAFDENGEVSAHVEAKKAQGPLRGDTVTLEGDVSIRDRADRVMRTDKAIYRTKTERIDAPGTVRFSGDNFEARGGKAQANLRTGEIEIGGPVDATFQEQK